MLGKNKIKYFRSLRLKKYREKYREYLIEGDKIIRELIDAEYPLMKKILATKRWLNNNYKNDIYPPEIVHLVSDYELGKISSFKTPGEVIAVMSMPEHTIDNNTIINNISLVLDKIQDPGNLGNIIRIADWFGIKNIFCSGDCADCFSPKVVQATMGAITRINIHYVDLRNLLEEYAAFPEFNIYGTFLKGESIYDKDLGNKGFIVMGNESRGISESCIPYITTRLFVPKYTQQSGTVESLNVSAATAIVCYEFRRKQ
jgi:TrmH family RNA methyltransferase